MVLAGFSRECVPFTFATLSHLVQAPIKYSVWCQTFLPQKDSPTPTLAVSLIKWSEQCPTVKLDLIYSVNNQRVLSADLMSATPYFWVGNPSKETANPVDALEVHAAIVYFKDQSVVIVNTIKVQESNTQTLFDFYIENITMEQFVERTLFLYQLTGQKKAINFQALANLLALEDIEKR